MSSPALPTTARRRLRRAVGAVAAALLVVAAGCGSGGARRGPDSTVSGAPAMSGEVPMAGTTSANGGKSYSGDVLRGTAGSGGTTAASGTTGAVGPTTPSRRLALAQRIAQTAELTLRIGRGSLDDVMQQATVDATRLGGYVTSSTTTGGAGAGPTQGTVVVRVPARRFGEMLGLAAAYGRVLSRRVGSEDLTQDYVDTRSRLRHAQAVERRLIQILDRAVKVGDVLAVQDRLDTVQEAIEIDRGRLDQLSLLTDLSTVSIRLREPVPPPRHAAAQTRAWSFGRALHASLHAAATVTRGGLVVAGALLPPALLAAILLPLVRLVRARRRRRPPLDDGRAPAAP